MSSAESGSPSLLRRGAATGTSRRGPGSPREARCLPRACPERQARSADRAPVGHPPRGGVSGDADRTARVWDLDTSTCVSRPVEGLPGPRPWHTTGSSSPPGEASSLSVLIEHEARRTSVAELSQDWGVCLTHPQGKTVWAPFPGTEIATSDVADHPFELIEHLTFGLCLIRARHRLPAGVPAGRLSGRRLGERVNWLGRRYRQRPREVCSAAGLDVGCARIASRTRWCCRLRSVSETRRLLWLPGMVP